MLVEKEKCLDDV